MLSLPDDWEYSLKGLAAISMEGVDAIRTIVEELEAASYIVRRRYRDPSGIPENYNDGIRIPRAS